MGTFSIRSTEPPAFSAGFTGEQWAIIEAAGKRTFDTEQRQQVHQACEWYLIQQGWESNGISAAAISKVLNDVRSHSMALMNLLISHQDDEAREIAHFLIRHRHYPSEPSLHVQWDMLLNLDHAAERALRDLAEMTVSGRPGPKHAASFRELVLKLGKVFSAAGGTVPRAQRSSFVNFVHSILLYLPGTPAPQSIEAVGERVRKVLVESRNSNQP